MKTTTRHKLIRTANHDEWLACRSKGIGSSEIGTLLGLNKFETPYQLWRRKMGMDAPKEENEAMLMGHLMEDAVAQRWKIETGRHIIKASQEEWLYMHPEHDYFRASPDRIYYNEGDKHNEQNRCILECKTTSIDVDEKDLPMSWFCQVQWLMHVTGYKRGSLAWINLTHRQFGYKDIEYDEAMCEWMADEAQHFWTVNIGQGIEPELRTPADVIAKYPRHTEGKTIDGWTSITIGSGENNQMSIVDAVGEIKRLKDEETELARERAMYEDAVKAAMGDAEAVTAQQGTQIINIATWKAAKDSVKFDAKAFRKDHPEEAEKYMKATAGSRRFLIK